MNLQITQMDADKKISENQATVFSEAVYQEALERDFSRQVIPYVREQRLKIFVFNLRESAQSTDKGGAK